MIVVLVMQIPSASGDENNHLLHCETSLVVRSRRTLRGPPRRWNPGAQPVDGCASTRSMGARALDAARALAQKCSMDRASRRLLAATYEERHRIERALHEGVQQDLIALSVRLQLLERSISADPHAVPALLAEMRADVRAVLERVRELAESVYPPLLADRGLAEALRALGSRVDDEGAAHPPEAVEAAAYFCCRDLRPRSVRLWSDDTQLRLELEGVTGDAVAARERAETLGGSLSGAGASLELTLPRGKGEG